MSDKGLKYIVFALLLVFYGSVLLHKIDLPAMDDMPRHVKNGELILQGHWDVIYKNVYSYTMPGQRFINHHWFSGVVFYLLHQAIGWSGLVIFKVVVLLAAFALMFLTALKRASFWVVSFFSIPVIILLSGRTGLRPEIFSFLFIALYLYVLTNSQDEEKVPNTSSNSKLQTLNSKLYWLIPIQLLWVNLHIFFIIGPAIVAGFLIQEIAQQLFHGRKSKAITPPRNSGFLTAKAKRLIYLLFATIAVCFINPNGISGALYPLQIFNRYGFEVSENQPLMVFFRMYPLASNISGLAFLACCLLFVLSLPFNLKRMSIFYFFSGIALVIAGFRIIRMEALFPFFFLPAVTQNLNGIYLRLMNSVSDTLYFRSDRIRHYFSKGIKISFITLLCFLILLKVSGKFLMAESPGVGLTEHSNDAADFIRNAGLKGPFFNDYDIGSYLIYNFYPQEKVFMDNRPEAYTPTLFDTLYVPIYADEEVWKRALDRYSFNAIILYQYNLGAEVRSFMYRRVADSSWAFVYADQYAVIFAKNSAENRDIVSKYRLTPETVEQRVAYLVNSDRYVDMVAAADVLNMAGKTERGMETLFRVVTKWPDEGKIWMVMAEWEIKNTENPKSPLVALLYLQNAIHAGWKTAEVYSFLGIAYRKIGFNKEAEQALRTALRINPEWNDAKEILKDMGLPN